MPPSGSDSEAPGGFGQKIYFPHAILLTYNHLFVVGRGRICRMPLSGAFGYWIEQDSVQTWRGGRVGAGGIRGDCVSTV